MMNKLFHSFGSVLLVVFFCASVGCVHKSSSNSGPAFMGGGYEMRKTSFERLRQKAEALYQDRIVGWLELKRISEENGESKSLLYSEKVLLLEEKLFNLSIDQINELETKFHSGMELYEYEYFDEKAYRDNGYILTFKGKIVVKLVVYSILPTR